MPNPPAPACSLEGRAYQERLRWIAELNARFLLRSERTDNALVQVYARQARTVIEELVRRERACCPALDFGLHETAGGLALHVGVPAHAAARADELLRPLQAEPHADAQACCSGCADAAVPAVKAPSAANSAIGTSAVAVVACGACCVLPLAFPAIASGVLGGTLAALAAGHAWLTALAAITLAVAWAWIGRQAKKRNARIAASTLVQMTAASVLTATVVAWPWLERPLMAALRH